MTFSVGVRAFASRATRAAMALPSAAVHTGTVTPLRLCTCALAAISLVGCATRTSRSESTVPAFVTARSPHAQQPANTRVLAASAIEPSANAANATRAGEANAQTASSAQSSERPAASAGGQEIEERTTPAAGTDVQAGIAVYEAAAPLSVVSAALMDFANYRQFLPRLSESRVVRRRRSESEVYLRADLLEGFGTVWAHERFRVTRATGSILVEGERIDGTMRRFDVRLEAVEIPGTQRTRIAVRLLGLPPFPLPSGYLTRQHGRWTARALRALGTRVEAMALAQARPSSPARH